MPSNDRLSSTTTVDQAAGLPWDVLVVGAGPSGTTVAREAARSGTKVLLVDRASFPRSKVCGCCLNGAALSVLDECGLGRLPLQCGAPALTGFCLATRGRFATVPLAGGVSLSRERLDAALIEAAIDEGVAFLDQTQAIVEVSQVDACRVNVKSGVARRSLDAKIVVVAGGLGSRVLAETNPDDSLTSKASRVGAGTVLDDAGTDCDAGTIYMACHRDGYAGLVRLEDGRLDVAAALDVAAIKQCGGVGPLVEEVLRCSGLPVPAAVAEAKWNGTPRLTRQRQHVYGDRHFVVGDAAGYIEPFTGEGIAWALATGKAVTPFVLDSIDAGTRRTGPAWESKRRQLIGHRMRLCRAVSYLLRQPSLVNIAVRLLSFAPGLARPIDRSLNKSFG
jgi:flavin-dependent dehydrogenase